MTPEREEKIREAWERDGRRAWRWSPAKDGYHQYLDVAVMPPLRFILDDATPEPIAIERLTFIGSYATMPGGSGPARPRYRFITCEGLIVHQERIQ